MNHIGIIITAICATVFVVVAVIVYVLIETVRGAMEQLE